MIFVSMSLLIVRSVDWQDVFSDKTRQPFANPDNLIYGPYITEKQRDDYLTQYVTMSTQDIYRGVCILVNNEHPYVFSETDPDGSEYENVFSIYKNKTTSYKVSGSGLFLQMDAIKALNDWFDAFYAEYENRNIMVNTAYRTLKVQKEIYDSFVADYGIDYANEYAQKPGYSEHHTGYAVDLAVYDEGDPDVEGDERMWKFDGKDEYFWAAQNCTQYGFILRYSASKEDVTGISYESWHYRYVGVGNALTIQNMGLSLEEYVNFIKDYSY
ncbi:MAG: D-alanyl-D-alanine carboxypeptidase family protein, partial [Eubacteriales bacterium]